VKSLSNKKQNKKQAFLAELYFFGQKRTHPATFLEKEGNLRNQHRLKEEGLSNKKQNKKQAFLAELFFFRAEANSLQPLSWKERGA